MSFQFDYLSEQMDEKKTSIVIPSRQVKASYKGIYLSEDKSTHRRMLQDLENYLHQQKNKEKQRIALLKQKQKTIGEEIVKKQTQKHQRLQTLQEQVKKEKLKQCTFHPKTNSSSKRRRSFNEFIEGQCRFEKKVKQKTEQLKKSMEMRGPDETYKPRINTNYSKKKERNDNSTVFQRLYSLGEKQKTVEFIEPEVTFHPVINEKSRNMARQAPVQQMLYYDALRRQEKNNTLLQSVTSEPFEKEINYATEKYAAQKFIREYFTTLQQLEIDTSFQAEIEYIIFCELLRKLGFISNEQEQTHSKILQNQRNLIQKAYKLLQNKKVNARNICVFLLGLMGIFHINPVNFKQGEQIDEEKQFNLDQTQGRKLQKQFDVFFRNRIFSQGQRRGEQKRQSYSFQPTTNKQSTILAEKFRNSMLEEANQLLQQCPELEFSIPEDGIISHTDLLILHKMANELKKQKQKQQIVESQLKQCTFKPITYSSSMKSSKISTTTPSPLLGEKRCHQLYEYHKQMKSKKASLQASRQDIENDPECTFKPKINKKVNTKKDIPFCKDVEETVFRMHQGRKKYEQKCKLLSRGEITLKQRSENKTEQQTPMLILDVNLGEKIDRIILYPGDQNKLQSIKDKFAKKHSLEQSSQQKLMQLLRTEMENVLNNCDEQDEYNEQVEQCHNF